MRVADIFDFLSGATSACARGWIHCALPPALCGRRRIRWHATAASPEQITWPSVTHGHVCVLSSHGVLRGGGRDAYFRLGPTRIACLTRQSASSRIWNTAVEAGSFPCADGVAVDSTRCSTPSSPVVCEMNAAGTNLQIGMPVSPSLCVGSTVTAAFRLSSRFSGAAGCRVQTLSQAQPPDV